jgi:hypothetical protein
MANNLRRKNGFSHRFSQINTDLNYEIPKAALYAFFLICVHLRNLWLIFVLSTANEMHDLKAIVFGKFCLFPV